MAQPQFESFFYPNQEMPASNPAPAEIGLDQLKTGRLAQLKEIHDLDKIIQTVISGTDPTKTTEWLKENQGYDSLDHAKLALDQKREVLLKEDLVRSQKTYEALRLLERIPLRFQEGDEVCVFDQQTEKKESGWKVMRASPKMGPRYSLVRSNGTDVSFLSREGLELAQDNIPVREGDQIIFPDEFLNPWTVRRLESGRAACVSGIQEKIFPIDMVEDALRENLREGRELLQTNEDQEIELKELKFRIQTLKKNIAQWESEKQAQEFARQQEQDPTTPEGVQHMRAKLKQLQEEFALVMKRGVFAGYQEEQQRIKTEMLEPMYWITKDRVQQMRLPARLSPDQHPYVSMRRGNGQVERHWQLVSYKADKDTYMVETWHHPDGSPLRDPQTGKSQKMEKDIAREELELLQPETNRHEVLLQNGSVLIKEGKPIQILYSERNGDMVVTHQVGVKNPNMTSRVALADQGRIIDETRGFLQKSLEAKELLEKLERQRQRPS